MLKDVEAELPGRPSLQLEIGNYMQGFGIDRAVKNKWLWQGMEKLGIGVYNVAEDDIAELMAQDIDVKSSDRFISANLLSTKTGKPMLHPYVIKSFPLKERRQPYRIGFVGVASRESFLKTESLGYTWADPVSTVKQWVPELKKECDFIVVLACVPAKDAIQMAVDNADINIILDGFKHQALGLPARINQSNVVFVEDEGRILGELRFNIGAKVEVQPLNHLLTRDVKDDPEMLTFVNQARAAITTAQHQLANAQTSVTTQAAATSSFVTANGCENCHQAAFQIWQNSKHAHAIEILKKEKKEFDTSCVTCHVTGSGKADGFIDLNQTAHLANVQCESCHGPGREHASNPSVAKMPKLTAQACVGCHTTTNSPEFEFSSYWQKIRH